MTLLNSPSFWSIWTTLESLGNLGWRVVFFWLCEHGGHGGQRARATGTGMRGRGSLGSFCRTVNVWIDLDLSCCASPGSPNDNSPEWQRGWMWGRLTRMSFLCSDEMQVLFIGRELGKVCRQVDMATSMCTWLSSIISITVQCSTVGSWYFAANL